MKYAEIHPAMRLALGAHEGFRKLGFRSDDIFVHLRPDHKLLVILRTQGKHVAINCGQVALTDQQFRTTWMAVARAVRENLLSDADLDRIWKESPAYQNSVYFVEALLRSGFKLPINLN